MNIQYMYMYIYRVHVHVYMRCTSYMYIAKLYNNCIICLYLRHVITCTCMFKLHVLYLHCYCLFVNDWSTLAMTVLTWAVNFYTADDSHL